MQTICIYNSKGGVGKTSTAHSLAFGLANEGRRVLLMDLDPQANLSGWCGMSPEVPTLDQLTRRATNFTGLLHQVGERVDLLPGSDALRTAESDIDREAVPQTWLARQLRLIPDRWDYVVLDCAPSMGPLSMMALGASRWVLVPVEPTALGLAGVGQAVERVEQIQEINRDAELLGILPVRVDRRKLMAQGVLEALGDAYGDLLFPDVRAGVRLEEAPSYAISIFEHAPKSGVAEDYMTIVKEVIRRVEG